MEGDALKIEQLLWGKNLADLGDKTFDVIMGSDIM